MSDLIQTSTTTGRPGQVTALLPTVATADTPFGPWTDAPHLYVDRLRISAGPDVDEAQLTFEFGTIRRPGAESFADEGPLDLLHRFVRIVIAPEDDDPTTWVGVVEIDEREALGKHDDDQQPGRQRLVAFGLARLLENTEIRESLVETPDGGEPRRIGCGLPFNLHERSRYVRDRGNRSAEKTDGVYLFADAPTPHEQWSAEDALRYLLKHHAPRDAEGEPLPCELVQDGDHLLDWYDVTVPTDRRTLKDVIDQLVSRRRGLGYVVESDDEEIVLRVFSFNDVELVTEFGQAIGKNPNVKQLDYDKAVDVARVRLLDLALDAFDVLRVEGERQTSTVTLDFACWWRRDEDRFAVTVLADKNQGELYRFVEDWRPGDERDYVEATSQDAGYAALDRDKQELNDALRREEANLRHVFSRFRLHPRWNQRVLYDDVWHNVFPVSKVSTEIEPSLDDAQRRAQWVLGLKILPFLLLQQGRDYADDRVESGEWEENDDAGPGEAEPEHPYRPPLVVASVTDDDDETRLVDGSQLNAGAASELGGMRWSIHAHVVDRGPVVALQVAGGPQHFLAASIIDSPQPENFDALPDNRAWEPGATNDRDDPATQRGLDYTDLEITVTIEAQDSVVEEWRPSDRDDLDDPPGGDGRPERVLTIRVPEARLDYVVPGTIVAVERGAAVRSEGGFLRDDRARLSNIAWGAGAWYGRPRRTLALTFRQVRTMLRVGDLIKTVGVGDDPKPVNTPITTIVWDWTGDAPTTTIETNYAALDLV